MISNGNKLSMPDPAAKLNDLGLDLKNQFEQYMTPLKPLNFYMDTDGNPYFVFASGQVGVQDLVVEYVNVGAANAFAIAAMSGGNVGGGSALVGFNFDGTQSWDSHTVVTDAYNQKIADTYDYATSLSTWFNAHTLAAGTINAFDAAEASNFAASWERRNQNRLTTWARSGRSRSSGTVAACPT